MREAMGQDNLTSVDTHSILSLCSGVGALDLGVGIALETLGIESRVVGYCEREVFCQTVLMARIQDKALDDAPICDNLSDIDERWRGKVDWIVAGFPCQPWSCAGTRNGKQDERWIWDDILGVIDRVKPRFCFFENVPGLCSGVPEFRPMADGTTRFVRHDGFDTILRTLAKRGFDAEWLHLAASDVGASHERERVFILAVSASQPSQWRRLSESARRIGDSVADGRGATMADAQGERMPLGQPEQDRPSIGETIARGSQELDDSTGARHSGTRQRADLRKEQGGQCLPGQGCPTLFAPGPNDPRWPEILAQYPHLAPAIEPGFRYVVDGLARTLDASRADQLRAIGNGVVPLQGAVALRILLHRAGLV